MACVVRDHSATHLRQATHVVSLFTDIAEETVSAHRYTVNLAEPSELAGTKSIDGFAQEKMPLCSPGRVHLDARPVRRLFHFQRVIERERDGFFQKHMQP